MLVDNRLMCTSISEKGQRIAAQLLLYSLQLLPQDTKKDIYATQTLLSAI